MKYEVRLFTGDFNQAGQHLPKYLDEVQRSMNHLTHQDSGEKVQGTRFTYELQYASTESFEIALVVFNYEDTIHPQWTFKQHDVV